MADPYLSAPVPTKTMPKGIPYIIANEAAERFSYYGMKTILFIFMTKYLLDQDSNLDVMNAAQATTWVHSFGSAVYFFPLIGALIADTFWGKYKTILNLSVVYCLGHGVLAVMNTPLTGFMDQRMVLAIGLGLIAIGSGGIKPCVSAHVGDQFGKSNAHLIEKVFYWFYFSINLGSAISTFFTPLFLEWYGPHVAFGVPGLLMLFATIFFWMGRRVFIHIPPGGKAFVKETFSKKGIGSIAKLFAIYVFVALFWALFDQTASRWVDQAERMDRWVFGIEVLSSQLQAINPVLVMLLIPLFAIVVYPAINKVFPLTPLRKIGIGFFITVIAFLVPAYVEMKIGNGEFPSISWQLLAYIVITAAEVFVSITCLEFSYTQAPKRMKSLVMGFFLLSVSLGNVIVAGVNTFIQNDSPSFAPDVVGEYRLQLAANDGTDRVTAETTITVLDSEPPAGPVTPPEDAPPEADAGRMVVVAPGSEVRMYAAADKGDADGDVSYDWEVLSAPSGSQVSTDSLDSRTTRNPSFTPDQAGEYTLRFTHKVGDAEATSETTVVASNDNYAPTVSAGDPMNFFPPSAFWPWESEELNEDLFAMLNGSATYDPNGDDLQYYWRFLEVPEGSSLTDDDIVGRNYPAATVSVGGVDYYLLFAFLMLFGAILFIPVAYFYKEETFIQDEGSDGEGEPVPADNT